jgi:hypothetical protein
MKNFLKFEPVASLAALLAFGSAVITALSYNQGWAGEAVAQIGLIWTSLVAFVGTFFVRASVTPNVAVDQKVHDTIVELAENPPVPQPPVV